MKMERIPASERLTVYRFGEEEVSHLLVADGRSLLIDCHSDGLRDELEAQGLPLPELILHTHVSPEHCREGKTFPDAVIRVPKGEEVLASDPEEYARLANTVWEDPEDWMNTMGREPYGVGGSVTCFPPEVPLAIGESVAEGETLEWCGLTLEAISLPAHGRWALGYLLKEGNTTLAFFSGDLLRHPACLVNVYDLVSTYGGTTLGDLPELLRRVASLGVEAFFPASGPVIESGSCEAEELAKKIEAYQESRSWQSGNFTPEPAEAGTEVGPFIKVLEGIYQDKGFGNTVILIDEEGRACVIDPGPCGYGKGITLEDRQTEFGAGFDLLEKKAGLKTVDLVLVTHMHGDHYDMAPYLRERYGVHFATWSRLAEIIEDPNAYPYSCLLPWYNLGLGGTVVDEHVPMGGAVDWNGTAIEVVHLPGHSSAHCGFILDFRGERLALTGDTIQSRGGAGTVDFIITNDSEPFTDGVLQAYQSLAGKGITLNLGGHGSRFRNCEAMYRESLLRVEHALEHLKPLIYGDDYDKAFRAPHMRRGGDTGKGGGE
ncbi:MAG: MBL fold metallo-hydrolase [Planctomycetota bacterium]|jgi:glyoxylase-like metal-dependent hydrolase (beta-lactamase superfamily II)